MADSYEITWRNVQCPDDGDEGSATVTHTSHTIEGLRGGTGYNITVRAINIAGSGPSNSIVTETDELRKCTLS